MFFYNISKLHKLYWIVWLTFVEGKTNEIGNLMGAVMQSSRRSKHVGKVCCNIVSRHP